MPKKTPKKLNNVDFIRDLMNRHGPLAEAFVIDAVAKLAEAASKADPKIFDNGLLNGHAWVAVAKGIHADMEARLGS